MKLKLLIAVYLISCCMLCHSQKLLKIYHGSGRETEAFDEQDHPVSNPKIKLKQGETFTITVMNANTLFYNYAMKTQNLEIESEDKGIIDLFSQLNLILSSRAGMQTNDAEPDPGELYRKAIDTLTLDIITVKKIISNSDKPEDRYDALNQKNTGGLRLALDKILAISFEKFHFNNTSLLHDLDELCDKAFANDKFQKEAFELLNKSLVQKVNDLKKLADKKTTPVIWRSAFQIKDTATKITLSINKIDKDNNSLVRDGNDKDFVLELATIVPYFKRSTLELVPVANIIFSKDVREFYLENNIVNNRLKSKTTIKPGIVLNANVAKFGELKEMSAGIGLGYKFNSKSDAVENLYFSGLFSYKNFFRIGAGVGFGSFPSTELKDGGKIGQPLPANIKALDDIINYDEKLSFFLTLSFTGLNLTKKK